MVIVITGASRGIGKAIAEGYAKQASHNFFLCSLREEALNETVSDLKKRYPASSFNYRVCDMSKTMAVKEFAAWILEQSNAVDILVNNAGIFMPGNVHDEREGLLEEIMQVNLLAPYHLTRALLPAMIKRKKGHVFNIASIAALKAYPGGGSYGISKFALDGFSKNLRDEMKPHGIKVTVVYPGATYTDSWKNSGIGPDRFMQVEDIAQMIVTASQLSAPSCVEEIVIRPQLGDL